VLQACQRLLVQVLQLLRLPREPAGCQVLHLQELAQRPRPADLQQELGQGLQRLRLRGQPP
jgi:hypothetical protein